MSDQFVGEIRLVPYNFAPQGWAFCQGQLLPIAQNTALFSLLGTFYGGDGRSTFALPNLQGRVAVGMGQGSGLSAYTIGQAAGSATVTLLQSQLPTHTHSVPAAPAGAQSVTPGPAFAFSSTGRGGRPAYALPSDEQADPATFSSSSVGLAGSSQPHDNVMPYQVLNYIIALIGIYPSRS
jgi:microcystin-dependent protein